MTEVVLLATQAEETHEQYLDNAAGFGFGEGTRILLWALVSIRLWPKAAQGARSGVVGGNSASYEGAILTS